jgi:hypothetical protein
MYHASRMVTNVHFAKMAGFQRLAMRATVMGIQILP